MHNHDKHGHDTEARKRELLRQGEFYRSGVAHAKAQVTHSARPEVMFHNVIDHATWALRARADALLKPTGTSVSVLAPYALTVLGFIRQRRLGKQAAAAAVLLAVAGWFYQRRRSQQELSY